MRINRFLARSGVSSRRHADELIVQGRVRVNGQIIRQLGIQVDESNDVVQVDGKVVSPVKGMYYIMLNKPVGYLVSAADPHHERLVTSLLGDFKGKVFPVGRLDQNSSGLLVFTNDGPLAFRLSHPRYNVKKTYEATCRGSIADSALAQLSDGILLDDGPTAPAEVKALKKSSESSVVRITVHEGRKRQVRRMFDKVGFPVTRLKRIAYGPLGLGNLAEGAFIRLSQDQVKSLMIEVGILNG